MANGSFLQTYLTQIKEISPTAKEQTFRSALENLFKELQQQLAKTNKNFNNIHFTHEPNNDKSGLGAPDFQVKLEGGEHRRLNTWLHRKQKGRSRLARTH